MITRQSGRWLQAPPCGNRVDQGEDHRLKQQGPCGPELESAPPEPASEQQFFAKPTRPSSAQSIEVDAAHPGARIPAPPQLAIRNHCPEIQQASGLLSTRQQAFSRLQRMIQGPGAARVWDLPGLLQARMAGSTHNTGKNKPTKLS